VREFAGRGIEAETGSNYCLIGTGSSETPHAFFTSVSYTWSLIFETVRYLRS
jgi:hypothetical protein